MYKLLLAVGVLCNVLAQLLLKQGMKNFDTLHNGQSLVVRALSLASNPFVLGALLSYGAGFALYSLVISKMELSRAYPAASVMAILLLSLISMTFLNEVVTTMKIFGLSFCILGILMVLY